VVVSIETISWSNDPVITLKTDSRSYWMVSFEHLHDVTVEVGDLVEVGQVLGTPSQVGYEGTGFGFTELAVWTGGATVADIEKVCPFSTLEEGLKPDYAQKINQFATDWESYIGTDVYAQNEWVLPGCLLEQMKENEAMNP
ncbi:MAG: hypothetical protein AABX02_04950, partial [archaeon]